MPRKHPPYPPELRRLVEMVHAGRSPADLAKEFEPSDQCIRNWMRQADRDAGFPGRLKSIRVEGA